MCSEACPFLPQTAPAAGQVHPRPRGLHPNAGPLAPLRSSREEVSTDTARRHPGPAWARLVRVPKGPVRRTMAWEDTGGAGRRSGVRTEICIYAPLATCRLRKKLLVRIDICAVRAGVPVRWRADFYRGVTRIGQKRGPRCAASLCPLSAVSRAAAAAAAARKFP